nr:hypothetical protein [Tanacetum cinerariifolium]
RGPVASLARRQVHLGFGLDRAGDHAWPDPPGCRHPQQGRRQPDRQGADGLPEVRQGERHHPLLRLRAVSAAAGDGRRRPGSHLADAQARDHRHAA